jgi:hypothetical protein
MKPIIQLLDDGSILVEWIRQGERFGISLEKNPIESGWYHVSTNGVNESGSLTKDDFGILNNFFRDIILSGFRREPL